MNVHLSDITATELRDRAQRQGMDPESYAAQLIEEAMSGLQPDDLVDSIYARFQQLGVTDDELGDLLEEEKHAARRERPPSARP